jgi:hypothetical protein
MGITTDDIKIRQSQNLSDDDDGGGYMTSIEVVDGSINNIFDDISRLDRTYGRVSLRKFFMHVDTDDTNTYYGAHMILSKQAADENIIVTLFTTDSDSDVRTAAVDRLESYVTLGPAYGGWLYGDHPAGSKTLSLFTTTTAEAPEIDDVWCLFNNYGDSDETYQYVRITAVESSTGTFTVSNTTFTRNLLTLTISDALEEKFYGNSMHNSDSTSTNVYTSTVSDAAEYYGVMTPTDDISSGDTTIMVDDIYAQLVPTSQTETSLTDQTPGEAEPVQQSGDTETFTVTSFSGTTLYLPCGICSGTLTLTIAGVEYTDNGDGVLMQSSNQAGTINYSTGLVTFTSSKSGSGTAVYDPGVGLSLVGNTLSIPVPTTGAGYTYIGSLWPLPEAGTITVDYMVDGTWYRLSDDGIGVLDPTISGTGVGTVNYTTGTLSLTCASIPDSDSAILIRWGVATEIIQLAGDVEIDIDPLEITLSEFPVDPGSVTISWTTGVGDTATATDNGNGYITGDATGTIIYGTGELIFTPTEIPVSGSEIDIDYSKYAAVVETKSATVFTLESAPKPGTLALSVTCSVGYGYSHTYTMKDDGNGNLSADGFSQAISQARACTSDSSDYADHTTSGSDTASSSTDSYSSTGSESTVTLVAGGISGTVDYVTGDVVIDLTGATATLYTISNSTTSKENSDKSTSTTKYSVSVSIN